MQISPVYSPPKKPIWNYLEGVKPYREFYDRIKQVDKKSRLQTVFQAWLLFLEKARDFRRKIWKIRHKEGDFAKECFDLWRSKFIKKRKSKMILSSLFNNIQYYIYYQFWESLIWNLNIKSQNELLEAKFEVYYSNKLKLRAFKLLAANLVQKVTKKQKQALAEISYYQLILKKCFYALLNFKTVQKIKAINFEKATYCYIFRLIRKGFYSWKKYSLSKVIRKAAILGYKQLKLTTYAPSFFQQLKLNYYLQAFSKIAHQKAQQ